MSGRWSSAQIYVVPVNTSSKQEVKLAISFSEIPSFCHQVRAYCFNFVGARYLNMMVTKNMHKISMHGACIDISDLPVFVQSGSCDILKKGEI